MCSYYYLCFTYYTKHNVELFLYFKKPTSHGPYLQSETRVLTIISSKILLAQVEDSPDGGEDSEHVPEECAIVNSKDFSSSLSGQTVIDKGQGWVSGKKGWQRDSSSGCLCIDVVLLGGTHNSARAGSASDCNKINIVRVSEFTAGSITNWCDLLAERHANLSL